MLGRAVPASASLDALFRPPALPYPPAQPGRHAGDAALGRGRLPGLPGGRLDAGYLQHQAQERKRGGVEPGGGAASVHQPAPRLCKRPLAAASALAPGARPGPPPCACGAAAVHGCGVRLCWRGLCSTGNGQPGALPKAHPRTLTASPGPLNFLPAVCSPAPCRRLAGTPLFSWSTFRQRSGRVPASHK